MLNEITQQLQQHKRDVQAQIESLQSEVSKIDEALGSLASIHGGGENPIPPVTAPGKKGQGMSASARAKIAAAQRARWARVHAGKAPVAVKPKGKRKISPEGIARIKAAQAKRWEAYNKANTGK